MQNVSCVTDNCLRYFARREGCEVTRSVCVCVCVCLSVCPLVRLKHTQTSRICLHVTRGHGSVLLRRQCDKLRISVFVDYDMFSHNGTESVRRCYV